MEMGRKQQCRILNFMFCQANFELKQLSHYLDPSELRFSTCGSRPFVVEGPFHITVHNKSKIIAMGIRSDDHCMGQLG